jgi:hypothetical protein
MLRRLKSRVDSGLSRRLPRPTYLFMRSRFYDARALVRRNPGRCRVLPDFIIIGAAKSGTTSLYGSLNKHPFVVPCVTKSAHFGDTKEVRYFDYNFERGQDWYRSHFPLEQERTEFIREHGRPFITGEGSPSYLSSLWVPRRIRQLLPNVKLIAVLRNPADRAYSQFQMSRREGEEPLESFEDALAQEEERLRPEIARMSTDPRYNSWDFGCWSYLARSRYAEQLERWLELFRRDQFLFVKAEDLFTEPEAVLDRAHDFLGLPFSRPDEVPRLNTAEHYDTMLPATREQLLEYFRPHNERLYDLIGLDFGWERETAPIAV